MNMHKRCVKNMNANGEAEFLPLITRMRASTHDERQEETAETDRSQQQKYHAELFQHHLPNIVTLDEGPGVMSTLGVGRLPAIEYLAAERTTLLPPRVEKLSLW